MNATDPLDRLRSSGPDLEALTARLSLAAARGGDLDVVHREVDSPVGRLLLAATDKGMVRVAFTIQGFDAVLGSLAADIGPRILPATTPGEFKLLDATAAQLEEYFDGSRRRFDVALERRTRGFRGEVLAHLPDIAYGSTESYADAASAVGNPRAVRAVGTACALNPLPILVPCHRVVRSDGTPGQYAGGAEVKARLLAFERSGV